jgi:hypothetical protein
MAKHILIFVPAFGENVTTITFRTVIQLQYVLTAPLPIKSRL